MATPSKCCATNKLNASASSASTARRKAKHAAADLAFEKDVTVQTHGHDKYQCNLGDVLLPDGMILNQELAKQGSCWWYRK
jgi:hypothetical protein